MTRFLDIKNMQVLQDYAHSRYYVQLKPDDTYDDLFVPTFWAYHRGKLRQNDLIRVRAHDGRFDVTLTVVDVKTGGVAMQRWPIEPAAEEAAAASEIGKTDRLVPFAGDGKPVVRVEFLPATNWRVIGLNGEVSFGHKDEPTALKAMHEYLAGIRYVMPSADAQADEAKRAADALAATEATKTADRKAAAKSR